MNKKNEEKIYAVTRRDFLRGGIFLVLSGFTGISKGEEYTFPATGSEENISYKISGWSGDSYDIAHTFRDGFTPAVPLTDEKKDLVVIGAGLSGLTVAYKLRDRDIMVLEYDSKTGGNAKSLTWEGKSFNIGSVYFSAVSEDYGLLYDEAGIKPFKVAGPVETWKIGNNFVNEPFEEENMKSLRPELRKKMLMLRKAMEKIYNSSDFPENPYENTSSTSLELDKITFAEWLKPYINEELKSFIDSYCYSAMGASSDTVSAFGGINFYSSELEGDTYSFSAGNSQIAMALVRGIDRAGKNRIKTSSYVYKIKQKSDDKISVYYFEKGQARAVEAKKVVIATPYFIASRLIDSLSDGQKEALRSQGYGSYITANLRFNRSVYSSSYITTAPDARSFTNFASTGWPENPGKKKEKSQIITCFAPYKNPVMGRCHMMLDSKEHIAGRIVNAFEKILPGSTKYLEEVYLTRWGHAIIINRPYMYTKWLPAIKKKIGSIYLSHSDGQGLPALENSLGEAFRTVKEIQRSE